MEGVRVCTLNVYKGSVVELGRSYEFRLPFEGPRGAGDNIIV